MTSDPRQLALEVLNRIERSGLTLDDVLDRSAQRAEFKSPADRALFNAIVYGVLRWRLRLDHILSHLADRPLKKMDPRVLNLLRIGLFQMSFLDRIPPSAAVNSAVNLVRTLSAPWAAAFVNAVLRRAGREHHLVSFPPPDDLSAASLAVNKSFPVWLLERWLSRYGTAATVRLCDAINTPAAITLRANTLKIDASELLPKIQAVSPDAFCSKFAPEGICNCRAGGKLFRHPVFTNGLCAVQDEGAQLTGLLVHPRPGERVLDACAGLGGKTGHMAQMMKNRGQVIAVDRSAEKLDLLAGEMKRLGIGIVKPLPLPLDRAVAVEDMQKPFDRVLVDAPCSGLGVLRRNPDIKWSPLKSDLRRYQRMQSRLLSDSASAVRTGGLLVYAVCSCEPEETEAVVAGFLKNHPGFDISPASEVLSGEHCTALLSGPYLRTYPGTAAMDGFFGVRFRRLK